MRSRGAHDTFIRVFRGEVYFYTFRGVAKTVPPIFDANTHIHFQCRYAMASTLKSLFTKASLHIFRVIYYGAATGHVYHYTPKSLTSLPTTATLKVIFYHFFWVPKLKQPL